jgi:hypothetical protein
MFVTVIAPKLWWTTLLTFPCGKLCYLWSSFSFQLLHLFHGAKFVNSNFLFPFPSIGQHAVKFCFKFIFGSCLVRKYLIFLAYLLSTVLLTIKAFVTSIPWGLVFLPFYLFFFVAFERILLFFTKPETRYAAVYYLFMVLLLVATVVCALASLGGSIPPYTPFIFLLTIVLLFPVINICLC